ncbi:hypothetical protein HGH93_13005 [Chitinophaga polysaccharea]|uniref:hypothetical protein n=1 Tax=Chitinophaga polysaccharea TaxID=1293035 RepID=UPI0014559C30|nr:hypothetical protein [Chitinophaga polysaccharea]NLR59027.1 hypothetical protein [Chitinophaga polysaccharea]
MKGKVWILSLYLFLPMLLRGQSNGMGLSPLITPPPEAASITRYGLYPVGLFTGLPSISIPVYTIKVRDFSLPISFDYHASGIKVDEFASWVGLGWSLNAGGAITRTVMGIPDDDPYGIFYNPVKRESAIVGNDYPMLERIKNRLQDSEPDIFYYNFAGHSGQFTIAPSKEVKTNSHTNLKIHYVDGVFSAVDPNGVTYWFEKKGITTSYAENGGVKYWPTTTWMLSKIILSNKVDTITFSYTEWSPGRTQTIDYHLSLGKEPIPRFDSTCPNGGCSNLTWAAKTAPEKTIYFNEFSNYYVSNIAFPGGKVKFVPKTSGRLDMGGSILDSVIVENSAKSVKKIALTHDFFYSIDGFNPYASTWDKYRLKLTGIREVGGTTDSAISYKMIYEEQFKLPPRMNCGIDWWGYSNGQNQNQQLLSLDDNGKQYTFLDNMQLSTTSGITPAAIRTPDENNMRAGTLKRIYYPTGGYTDFELEANRISLQKTVPKGGGNYLVAAKKDDPPGVSYRSLEFTSPVTIPLNDPSPAELKVLIPLWNSVTKPYILFENLTTGTSETYNSLPGEQVSRTIKIALVSGQKYRITANIFPNPGDPNDNPDAEVVGTLTWVGRGVDVIDVVQMGPGLRIKTIKSFTASDSLVKREDYKYGESESGNGMVSFFNYLFERRTYEQNYNFCWGGRANMDPINQANYNRLEILSRPLFSYSDIGGSSIFYPVVTRYESDGITNNGKTVYKYDYELDEKLDYRYPDPRLLVSTAWKSGNLLTESTFKRITDTSYQLIKEINNQYQAFYIDTIYGLKVVSKVIYPTGRDCVGGITADPSRLDNDFGYFEYPIANGVKKVISSTTKTFGNNKDSIAVTTSYSYQNLKHLLPTAIETKNSKGVLVKTTMKYAQDKLDITGITSQESTAIDSMVERNLVETLIEKDEYTNDILMQRTHFEYGIWGSAKYLIALKKAKQKLATNNMEDHFEIIDYDNYGNVLERSNSNNVHEVYYWGYNDQYPVAKVLNSTYALVKSLLNSTIIQNPSSDDVLQAELNKLRVNIGLTGSQVTTYAYDPLLGVSNIVDEKGRNIYYKYDGFGRLAFIKDQNGKIVKLYDYKYQVPLNQ